MQRHDIVRPFNPIQIPNAKGANRDMTLEIRKLKRKKPQPKLIWIQRRCSTSLYNKNKPQRHKDTTTHKTQQEKRGQEKGGKGGGLKKTSSLPQNNRRKWRKASQRGGENLTLQRDGGASLSLKERGMDPVKSVLKHLFALSRCYIWVKIVYQVATTSTTPPSIRKKIFGYTELSLQHYATKEGMEQKEQTQNLY